MTAEPNVTTPTPEELEALRDLIPKGPFLLPSDGMPSPYRPEGEAWTPVDEHDGEVGA